MLDFEQMVSEELLMEATPTPIPGPVPTPTPTLAPTGDDAEEKLIGDGLFNYLETKYNDIKAQYTKRYNSLYSQGAPFPTPDEFKALIYAVSKNSLRNVKDSSPFLDIRNTFPLLDLISRLKESAKKHKTKFDQNEFNVIYKDFFQRLTKSNTKLPLDYVPIDPWARTVLVDFYKKNSNNIVSQLKLDQFQDKSILQVVLGLLALRKAGWITRIDKRVAPRIESSEAWVTDLIINFANYGVGEIKVPGEFTLLYDQVTPRELVEIGAAAYEYYMSESKRLNKELDESKKMDGFKALVQNEPLIEKDNKTIFDWSSFVVSGSATTTTPSTTSAQVPVTSSFSLFDMMYDKIVLNEYNPISIDLLDEKKKGQAARKQLKSAKASALASQSVPTASSTPIVTPTPSPQPPISTPPPAQTTPGDDKPQDLDGGYILKNIPKDTDLYKKLLALAEYIKTSSTFVDKLAKVTGAASALTSGMKGIGGKTMS